MDISLPFSPNLTQVVGDESVDFAVTAKRAQPLGASLMFILFATFWLFISSIVFFGFVGPVLMGNKVHFETNGVPTTAGPNNLAPLAMPALIGGTFMIIGVLMMGLAIYNLFKKGGVFVGTSTRLIHESGKNIKSIDWEQFTGEIHVRGKSLKLVMRTGKMMSRNKGPDRYVPNEIWISGVPDVYEIEKICRQRIKENDPTPANPNQIDFTSNKENQINPRF